MKLPATDTNIGRDLRKMGCVVLTVSQQHPNDEHKRVWYYQITFMPKWVTDELRGERVRVSGVAA